MRKGKRGVSGNSSGSSSSRRNSSKARHVRTHTLWAVGTSHCGNVEELANGARCLLAGGPQEGAFTRADVCGHFAGAMPKAAVLLAHVKLAIEARVAGNTGACPGKPTRGAQKKKKRAKQVCVCLCVCVCVCVCVFVCVLACGVRVCV